MRSKNTALHIGHLGKKPELKFTPNGTEYSRFSVACNYSFKQDGEWVNGVDWIPFIAYGPLAETVVKYLDKGSHVSVDSRIKPWKSGEGKNARYGMDLVVTDILFLDAKNQAASPEEVAHVPAGASTEAAITDDDIPF
ncbi:MAG TPA: single-stranded DNA-binding protein [Candidatus Angelobacter sp.]|nr:single-stranded DNA-binding protein [Candidatus Angelobacter sp.]